MSTGFLHPGAMGASLAATCSGASIWLSEGRSNDTRQRAAAGGMIEAESLEDLVRTSEVIVSVCPPSAAAKVAEEVRSTGFGGIYVDVNAIAPSTARTIGDGFRRFVDGGIIGPPVRAPAMTRLYLAGDDAATVAELWAGSLLEVRVVDGEAGAASAVKACFAAWTKGTAALLLAIRALARAEGIEQDLLHEWATSAPGLAEQCELTAMGNAPKAWRFVGELEEIGKSLADHGLPDGFGSAAAEVFDRLERFKGVPDAGLAAVIDELLAGPAAAAPSIIDPLATGVRET